MQKLDSKSVWLFFVSSIIGWIIFLIFFGMWVLVAMVGYLETNGLSVFGALIIGILLLLIVPYIWARLTYHFYLYDLSASGLAVEKGVIYKKYTTIPYERIQNVDIDRSLLARILGLSSLSIQTAGTSGKAEGNIPGLSQKDAVVMRDRLIELSRKSRKGGL